MSETVVRLRKPLVKPLGGRVLVMSFASGLKERRSGIVMIADPSKKTHGRNYYLVSMSQRCELEQAGAKIGDKIFPAMPQGTEILFPVMIDSNGNSFEMLFETEIAAFEETKEEIIWLED